MDVPHLPCPRLPGILAANAMPSPVNRKPPKGVNSNLARMIRALRYGKGAVRVSAVIASLVTAFGVVFGLFSMLFSLPSVNLRSAEFAMAVGALLTVVTTTLQRVEETDRNRFRIDLAEKNVAANPDKPQLVWELAQVKLESYLTRNLSQVRSIFALSVFVMLVGFALISIGAYWSLHDEKKFRASVLSAVSGLIVSFIGGTFLVLYKATMAQAKDYVTILERINAVGMSVQILESLSDNPRLKQESVAEVAKQLLHMYSTSAAGNKRKTKGAP